MSDVRLSNGSPTLERTEPRVPEPPKPSACRNLFGPVDHDELARDFKDHMRNLEEAASARWGFDFARHTPLATGRLQWELVDCKDVPEFYSRPPRRVKRSCPAAGSLRVDLNGNHSSCGGDADHDNNRSEGPMEECTEQCTGMRKRPACHDNSAQTKRSHTSSEEVSCPNLSSSEHTPRKTSPKRQT